MELSGFSEELIFKLLENYIARTADLWSALSITCGFVSSGDLP
jgi:hypothetical protein